MENISFDLYRLFYVVAKNQSISKSANMLYITQPAVTQGIKRLEDQIGGNLFFRNKKGVILTEEGLRLYKYIESSIEILDNAQNNFNKYLNLEAGKIRIRSGNMLEKKEIYDNISRFMKKYPNIEIEIKDGISSESIKGLLNGENDIVILNLPFKNEYPDKISISELGEKNLKLYCSKEIFDNYICKQNVSIKDINNLNFIIAPFESNTGKVIKSFFDKYKIELKTSCISPNTETRNYFAEESLGILVGLEDSVNKENLIEIKIKEELPKVKIGIATLNNDIIGMATKEILKYIKGEK